MGRFPAWLAPERFLEDDTRVHQPVVMIHAAFAVGIDLRIVGPRAEGGLHEGLHVLDGVFEAQGPLQRSAAAEIDEAAGHGSGAALASGTFEH